MNNHDADRDAEDFLTAIHRGLDQQAIPPQPSIDQTMQWLESKMKPRLPSSLPTSINRRTMMRIALPSAAVAATVLLTVTLFTPTQSAYAQVVAKLKQAASARFTIESTNPKFTGVATVKSPDWMRIDFQSPGQAVNVTNNQTHELISYEPNSGSVKINSIPVSAPGWDILQRLQQIEGVPLEQEKNTFAETEIYSVFEGHGKVWIDKNSKLPKRVELNNPAEIGGGQTVFRDFEWDVAIDEAIFKIPEGRSIVRSTLLATPTEAELVAAFRIRQSFTQEPYPADFFGDKVGLKLGQLAYDLSKGQSENFQIQSKTLGDHFAEIGITVSESQNSAAIQQRIDYLCMKFDQWQHKILRNGEWVGTDVRPGESKPLCWWRDAKGIRVLDADLTIHDASEPPKTQ